ncbi:AAA family ATPase [Streptomyces sp. NBC_00878]|uniref:AAA family ATPase n=1 Tax=Streptomyces sp. NBC_00878 TaxID=2975854 RepID=UPI00225B9640|nr:AAA family ATPase [Streptomyces sp. NBC_00878]MCX4904600.1 helicase RepA family protein [Streptomyces sp. NBC_00878]
MTIEPNARLALWWLLNPGTVPLESLSDDAQRIVAALSTKLPDPDVDAKTLAIIEAHRRDAAEYDKAKEIASYDRAKERAAKIKEEEFSAALESEEGRTSLAARFAADALSADSLDNIDAHEPLIAEFINRDTVSRIFGPPKSLKSFIALSMAAAIGTGERWFGYRTTEMPVLYVVAEGARGVRPRVRAWEQMNDRKMTGVTFYPRAVQIGDDDQMRELIAYARQGEHGLVIFDTQARCTVGHEENSNSEMGKIVARLDKLREWTKAAVMLVHHSGNEGGRGRGATAILAAIDSEFEVKRDRRAGGVVVKSLAQRDMVEAPDLALEAVKTGDSLALRTQGAFTAETVRVQIIVTGKQAEALCAIAEFGEIGASPTGVAEHLGKKDERAKMATHMKGLISKALIVKVPNTGRYQVTYEGQQQADALAANAAASAREEIAAQLSIEEP